MKIKVLQLICPVGFYGAERWILALANNLNSDQVTCDLAVTEEGGQNLEIVDRYPSEIGNTYKLKMSSPYDVSVITRLCNLIREREIDIIHTHGYKSEILGIIAAKKTGIKAVSTPHGFGEKISFKLKAFIRLGCMSFRFFDKVVPLSDQLYQEVEAMGIKPPKLSFIKNGVDLSEVESFVRPATDIESAGKSRHIGFVGQMIPRKGIKELLAVFDGLWQENNELKLSLLGDGIERASLEAFADQLPSRKAISFLGFRSDRLEIMQTFDLFAMTSSSEGIPRCLMEAMAMKLPVAAYDIPGIDVLVENNKTGLLAPLGDRDLLAKHWESLLYDPVKANAIAESGRDFVQENFSGARMAREYEVLFSELMGR